MCMQCQRARKLCAQRTGDQALRPTSSGAPSGAFGSRQPWLKLATTKQPDSCEGRQGQAGRGGGRPVTVPQSG